jgi:hypothetical protein
LARLKVDQQHLYHRHGAARRAENSDIKPPFALFTWSGREGDTEPAAMNVKISADFAPEAMFAIPGSSSSLDLAGVEMKKK